jgi:hypothetical protein
LFRLNDPNWPHVYKEQEIKFAKSLMSEKEMKKLPFTAYDDLPSDPDDEI